MRPRNPLKLERLQIPRRAFRYANHVVFVGTQRAGKKFPQGRKLRRQIKRLFQGFEIFLLRERFYFSVGRVFAGQRAYRKIFLRFFPRSVEGRLLRRKALCNHVQAARLPYGKACGKSQRQTCRTRQQHSRSCFQGGVSVRVGLQKN